MAECFRPIKGYRGPRGRIVDSPVAGFYDRHITTSCGQCKGCRKEHARQWAVRIMHEAQMHQANSFVTLTYDDEHLPAHGGLHIRDWQLFAKRFRKKFGPFRFYHCGEYGDSGGRPHYHVCLFGHDFSGDRKFYKIHKGNRLYVSAELESVWGKGFAPIGDLTFGSATYVARYTLKKLRGKLDKFYGLHLPPYSTMSRNPGIGASWLEKFGDQVYPRDEVISGGRPQRPPKYYDLRWHDGLENEYAALKARRAKKVNRDPAEDEYPRINVREEVEEANANFYGARDVG